MRPTFGSRLHELVFADLNAETLGLAEMYVKEALAFWEPRIEVVDVHAEPDPGDHGDHEHRHRLSGQGNARRAQPGLPVLPDTRRIANEVVSAMPLPTPTLDDRRFQDIVDQAKKLIPLYCPDWTDHNVSDPWRDADRAPGLDDRHAPVPGQPGTGQDVHRVPRDDRPPAEAAPIGASARSPSTLRRRCRRTRSSRRAPR